MLPCVSRDCECKHCEFVVIMQGELVDRVESHVEQSKNYTEIGKKELHQASVYHAKARKVFTYCAEMLNDINNVDFENCPPKLSPPP